MKFTPPILLTLFLTIFSCSDEEPSGIKETTLLTVNVEQSYFQNYETENWIMVHDDEGNLLTSKRFNGAVQFELTTNKPGSNKISVTHMAISSNEDDDRQTILANTYVNTEKGKVIILRNDYVEEEAEVTAFNVTVRDVYYPDYSATGATLTTYSQNEGILTLRQSMYADEPIKVIPIKSNNEWRYMILDEIEQNGSYEFSFNEMKLYDNTVTFEFPASRNHLIYTVARDPKLQSRGGYFGLFAPSDAYTEKTQMEIPYTTEFGAYLTKMVLVYTDYDLIYHNSPTIPDGSIDWPQTSDFSFQDKSFSNFTFTSTKPYVWRTSTFTHYDPTSNTYINWDIHASGTDQSIKELPAELTSSYPLISLSSLHHSGTLFYTKSPAFDSFVKHLMEKEGEPAGEHIGIRVRTN